MVVVTGLVVVAHSGIGSDVRMMMKNLVAFLALALSLPAFAVPQESKSLRIYWIDGRRRVDARRRQGGSLLMDCGWPGEACGPDRGRGGRGAVQIDHYLTSHYHTDHWGASRSWSGTHREVLPPRVSGRGEGVDAKPRGVPQGERGQGRARRPGAEVPEGAKVKMLARNARVEGERPERPR
jgi:glyoxylase-like metal-dependent hydrolase (beta-lactamase superfamily II)